MNRGDAGLQHLPGCALAAVAAPPADTAQRQAEGDKPSDNKAEEGSFGIGHGSSRKVTIRAKHDPMRA